MSATAKAPPISPSAPLRGAEADPLAAAEPAAGRGGVGVRDRLTPIARRGPQSEGSESITAKHDGLGGRVGIAAVGGGDKLGWCRSR